MKVGLLLCDHVAPHLQKIDGDYPQMFRNLLPTLDLTVYDLTQDQFPLTVDAQDAYITTGSKCSVYDEIPWVIKLKSFIRLLDANKKRFVGVCFGHQMMAEALGGRVRKSDIGWCVGVHQFTAVSRAEWMQPPVSKINILMSCQDQIETLPPNSTVLAEGTDCRIGLFQVGDHMLGMQGHPEFPKEYASALMEERMERIGPAKVQLGLESLNQNIDQSIISNWIVSFLDMPR